MPYQCEENAEQVALAIYYQKAHDGERQYRRPATAWSSAYFDSNSDTGPPVRRHFWGMLVILALKEPCI